MDTKDPDQNEIVISQATSSGAINPTIVKITEASRGRSIVVTGVTRTKNFDGDRSVRIAEVLNGCVTVEVVEATGAENFDLFVERTYQRAYQFALSKLSNPSDAEDAVQEAYINLLEYRERGRAVENMESLFFTMLTRRCYDTLKRRCGEKERMVSMESTVAATSDRRIDEVLTADLLNDLMKCLNENEQAVLRLKMEGNRYQEIADQLNIPVGTVRSRLSRAREKIMAWLSNQSFIQYHRSFTKSFGAYYAKIINRCNLNFASNMITFHNIWEVSTAVQVTRLNPEECLEKKLEAHRCVGNRVLLLNASPSRVIPFHIHFGRGGDVVHWAIERLSGCTTRPAHACRAL